MRAFRRRSTLPLREHLGISLGDMIGSLIGDGDWVPQPERWSRASRTG